MAIIGAFLMTLAAGTHLGAYEILEPLGAGGMGEVYRARDVRLDRSVAVKTMAADLAMDAESRQRFDVEARAVSALSHPNICALFDVGRNAPQHHDAPPAGAPQSTSGSSSSSPANRSRID